MKGHLFEEWLVTSRWPLDPSGAVEVDLACRRLCRELSLNRASLQHIPWRKFLDLELGLPQRDHQRRDRISFFLRSSPATDHGLSSS